MTALRAALIGYGLAGRVFHGPLLRATPGVAVTAVVVADRERRAQAARDHPAAIVHASADELWGHRDAVDLVVIATPPASHVALAEAAIDAGLAVVVEKPLAPTAAEGRALVERARARGVLLVPFHNRRWDSDQVTLRRLMAEGALGDIHRYESRFERWRPEPNPAAWRETLPGSAGGGVLLDLGVHLVDQALLLFGPVAAVAGEVDARRGGADDDVFIALHHTSGVRSHLWAGAVTAAPGPRLRVLGSAGAYVVQDLDSQEAALRGGADPRDAGFGAEPADRWGWLVRGDDTRTVPTDPGRWRDFYPQVVRALRSGDPAPVLGVDAVATLEVLDAVRAGSHPSVATRRPHSP